MTRGLPGGVLLDHVGHHGDGGVDPGAGGGGPRVTRAPGTGAGGGRGHPVLRLSGHVNEEPPHAVSCHGCDLKCLGVQKCSSGDTGYIWILDAASAFSGMSVSTVF